MRSESGATALHAAAERAHAEVLGALLAAGSHADEVDLTGRAALSHAAEAGDLAAVALLLEAGSDVRATDENGWNALHYAAAEGKEDVAIALALGGVPTDTCTRGGSTLAALDADVSAAVEEAVEKAAAARDLEAQAAEDQAAA